LTSLGVPAALTAALAAAGIDTPFPIQAAVLPDAPGRQDRFHVEEILARARRG
jgi:superfamily II DNA/RNA helicase